MKNWMQSSFEKLKEKEILLFTAIFTILLAIRIWLITGIPKLLIYGPHDDLFFAKAAHYIIHGQWMGPYTQMTLIKVPFYSFFLIFSYLTGLPLFLNETLFYILACLVLYVAFSPLIQFRWWRLLLFALICYCPISLATSWNLRVYREFIYVSLTLYVISFSIGLFLRLDRKISQFLIWSIGLGLSMGAFMITREEGVWIYPILFLFLSCCLLFIWMKKIDNKIRRSFLVLLPILLWYIPVTIVSALNYSHYGFWGTTENLDPDFNRVLNTLGRIKSSRWYPFALITKDARMKAYEVSPLFNELKSRLESSVPNWNINEDKAMSLKPDWYLNQYGNGGSDVSSGFFLWLLRDAVYSKGYYADGKYPSDFYKQLADQLESACTEGTLVCSRPQKTPFIGAIDQRHYSIILRMFFENIFHLLNQDYVEINSLDIKAWPVWPENKDEYKYFEEFVYNPLDGFEINSAEDTQYLINGKIDLRVKILPYKEKIMEKIIKIYDGFTLSVFLTGFISWIFLLISTRRGGTQEYYLAISFFMMGLFFSRLMTLTIVDATTSTPGRFYGASNYIFIYIFSFLMLYWILERLIATLREARKRTT
jgi:hypothetical protein